MKLSKIVFAFLLGILFTAIISTAIPQTVYAACGQGTEPPCPPSGGGKKKKPTATPPVPTSVPTSIPTLIPNPTATSAATIPLTVGGGAGDPNGQLPAVQNPNTGSSHMSFPFGFPGGLAGLIGLLFLLLGGLLIGLLVPAVRSWLVPAVKPGSSLDGSNQAKYGTAVFTFHVDAATKNKDLEDWGDGSDRMGAQPHMDDGSIGNPDLNIGTPSEVAPGPPDMPNPTQSGGGLL